MHDLTSLIVLRARHWHELDVPANGQLRLLRATGEAAATADERPPLIRTLIHDLASWLVLGAVEPG